MPEQIAAGAEAAVARLLRRAGARAGEGRVLPAARQARHHADQPAQHLHPHGADPAGHPHAARRRSWRSPRAARARRAAACSTATRRRCCARCSPSTAQGRVPNERGPVRGLARLLRRNPTEAERTFWEAFMSDRRFAGQRLQAAGAGRPAHHRFRLVPAAGGDRARARRTRSRRQPPGARRAAGLAHRARLSRGRRGDGARWRRMSARCWTDSPRPARLALQRLELRRGAGAQETEIAADREEADAALGAAPPRARRWRNRGRRSCRPCGTPRRSCRAPPRRYRNADRAPCRRSARSTGRRDRRTARRCPGTAAIASRLAIAVLVSIMASVTIAALASFRYCFGSEMPASVIARVGPQLRSPSGGNFAAPTKALGVGDRVDHRRDDAFGAEVERAARGRESAERHAHDRRRARGADRGDARSAVAAVSHRPCCWSMVTATKPSRAIVSATIGAGSAHQPV